MISELQITVEASQSLAAALGAPTLKQKHRKYTVVHTYVLVLRDGPPSIQLLALQLDSQLSSNKSKFSCCSRSFYAANFNIFCRASHTNSRSRYSWTIIILHRIVSFSIYYACKIFKLIFIHFMLTQLQANVRFWLHFLIYESCWATKDGFWHVCFHKWMVLFMSRILNVNVHSYIMKDINQVESICIEK